MEANKEKNDLSLSIGEWKMIHDAIEPIARNGAWSIRHLEGAVLVILDAIKERYNQ